MALNKYWILNSIPHLFNKKKDMYNKLVLSQD